MYIYKIKLSKADGNTHHRELHIIKNSEEKIITVKNNINEYQIMAKEGEHVTFFLVDVAANGGQSDASEILEFSVGTTDKPRKPDRPSILSTTKANQVKN